MFSLWKISQKMDVYRVTRGFTVDLNRHLKIYLEQIRKNPPWLSMAM